MGIAIVGSQRTETVLASFATLPHVCASSKLRPDVALLSGKSSPICRQYLGPRLPCLIIDAVTWVGCTNAWGGPPPNNTTDVFTERAMICAASTTSWMISNWKGFLRFTRDVAIPTAIAESATPGQKIGTLAL